MPAFPQGHAALAENSHAGGGDGCVQMEVCITVPWTTEGWEDFPCNGPSGLASLCDSPSRLLHAVTDAWVLLFGAKSSVGNKASPVQHFRGLKNSELFSD